MDAAAVLPPKASAALEESEAALREKEAAFRETEAALAETCSALVAGAGNEAKISERLVRAFGKVIGQGSSNLLHCVPLYRLILIQLDIPCVRKVRHG